MQKPRISLIVPHWPIRPEVDGLLKRCIQSIPADEKIIIVNEGTGMGKAINKGFELATGDYFLVSNNDCELVEGDIYDLCDPKAICIPDMMEGQWELPRAFYCFPREIYDLVGGYDEEFGVGYWEDDDLIKRWKEAGIQFIQKPVKVKHNPGTTLDTMPNRDKIFSENKERYEGKWGKK